MGNNKISISFNCFFKLHFQTLKLNKTITELFHQPYGISVTVVQCTPPPQALTVEGSPTFIRLSDFNKASLMKV